MCDSLADHDGALCGLLYMHHLHINIYVMDFLEICTLIQHSFDPKYFFPLCKNVILCSSMAEGTGTGKRTYVTWDDEMDDALLEVLVEHHNKGDHAQNGWKPHVYMHAIRNVKDKCNKDITKDNISGRMRTLDHHYEVVSKILSQSGFGWDWTNNRLSMDSDDVWDKYVEVTMHHEYTFCI